MLQENYQEKLSKSLLRVALPIALQSLIGSSLNLVDNFIVGQLGEIALASVGLSIQIFFVHWMVLYGFCGGAATFMAQFWGNRDLVNIRKTIGITVSCTFIMSLCFFIPTFFAPEAILRIFTDIPEVIQAGSGYVRIGAINFLTISVSMPFTVALRATQQTRIPLIIGIVIFIINTVLNFTFVFGNSFIPAMGVHGSALATAIARGMELILVFTAVFAMKNKLAGKIEDFRHWSRDMFRRIIKNALPTTINETMWGLGTSMYSAAYGRISATAFAAVQVGNTILNLFIMTCFSLGDATLILLGEKLGRGELREAESAAKKILRFCVVMGIVAGILLFIFSGSILRFFELTSDGQRFTRLILLIYSAFFVIKLYNSVVIVGVLRGGGDTKFAMYTESLCVWLIGVPLAFIGALYFKLPVYFVVILVNSEELVKMVILGLRVRSGKWIRNLVSDIEKE
ncbi:MATE family efflux transporter [Clostridia bacterium]|nr:MATE family efflux transporter [Clostridia bacterium]